MNVLFIRSESLTANDGLNFRFAVDGEGNHGYLGADDSFIPFKSGGDFSLIGEISSTSKTITLNISVDSENTDVLFFVVLSNGLKADGSYGGLPTWTYSYSNLSDVSILKERSTGNGGRSGQRLLVMKATTNGTSASITIKISDDVGYNITTIEAISI